MGIGTLFTLFVVPTMYLLLGERHSQAQASMEEPLVEEVPLAEPPSSSQTTKI